MKKFLSIITAAIILCASVCPAMVSVSAGKYDSWVLGPDAEYITHDGLKYYPLDTNNLTYYLNYGSVSGESGNADYIEIDLDFDDQKTEKTYDGSYVTVPTGVEGITVPAGLERIIVEVQLFDEHDDDIYYYGDSYIYVEESHLQEYTDIVNGIADEYRTYSYYSDDELIIDAEDYTEWLTGDAIKIKGRKLSSGYDWNYIYACDSTDFFESECGIILREDSDDGTDELYLLRYSDYDRTYFYRDGGFAAEGDEEVTIYRLEDMVLRDEILKLYDTEPEDDLDWLVTEEVNTTFAAIFCSIVFGFVPFALMVFAVVMLIKVKDKKYRRPYIVMLIGSAVVLLACVGVFVILI